MNKLQKPLQKVLDKGHSIANKQSKPIMRAYKTALDDVRTDIAAIYMKYTKDGEITISAKQRLKELKSLESQLAKHAKDLNSIDKATTQAILGDVFEETYYRTAYELHRGIKDVQTLSILRPEMVRAAVNTPIEGKMFSSRIWANKKLLVKRVKRDVKQALTQGKSVEKLARQIKKDFGSSAYESMRLIQTEVARVQSEAQDEIYKTTDAVKKVMYDATLDDLTSDICQSLDGKMFDKDSDYPKPPQHSNCRSAIIPVVEGWEPTKKKENIGDKKYIDYTTYDKWKNSVARN